MTTIREGRFRDNETNNQNENNILLAKYPKMAGGHSSSENAIASFSLPPFSFFYVEQASYRHPVYMAKFIFMAGLTRESAVTYCFVHH